MELVKDKPNRRKMLETTIKAGEDYCKAIEPIIDIAMANKRAEVWSAMTSDAFSKITDKFYMATYDLSDYVLERAEDEAKENDATTKRFQITIIVLTSLAVLVAAACSVFIGITILVVKQ